MWACYNFLTCQDVFWQRATWNNFWHSGALLYFVKMAWQLMAMQSYLIDLCDQWLNAQWWSHKLLWCTWWEPHIMTDFTYLRCHRLKTNFLYRFIFSWYTDRLLHWYIWHHSLYWKLSTWHILMLPVMINLSSWHPFHFHWMVFIFKIMRLPDGSWN